MIAPLFAAVLAVLPLQDDGPPIPSDPRVQVLLYDAGAVVPLRVALGYQTTVILAPDERIETIALGDSGAWEATPSKRGDLLFIKPLRAATTNLTVVTDARVYAFILEAAPFAGMDTPFTVQFSHAPTERRETSPPPAVQGRYRLSGSRSLRPAAISDDGARTQIEWRRSQALPAIYARDAQGRETLVEGHVRDGLYVIDAVQETLVFRRDRETAQARRSVEGGSR